MLFAAVDQHMNAKSGVERGNRVADAPARREVASRASGGTGEYDAPSHAKVTRCSLCSPVVRLRVNHSHQ